jgi:hypothetical protein
MIIQCLGKINIHACKKKQFDATTNEVYFAKRGYYEKKILYAVK